MNILTEFADTLKELMADAKLTHQDVENETGISNGNVSMWLHQLVAPTVPALIRLSVCFNCSIEYLLNRSNVREYDDFELVSSLAERLKQLAREKQKAIFRIGRETKIADTSIRSWVKGRRLPYLHHLVTLANYFGCTVDYLVGRSK